MAYRNDFTIVIADDHPILLKGIYDELTNHGYNVVGKGTNGAEALHLIETNEPDIALLDIDMPVLTGFEVVRAVLERGLKTKFIVLSFHKEAEYIAQAKALQIDGYLLKEDSFAEIEKCMDAVLNNEEYFSSSFDNFTLKNVRNELRKLQLLTPSEMTILKLIAKQTKNNEIADILCVSVRTVEKHRSNIIDKLNLNSGTNMLTSWALLNKNVILDV